MLAAADVEMEDIDGEDDEEVDLRVLFRNLRDASDPFSLPEPYFRSQYRFPRDLARQFVDQLRAFTPRQRSSAIHFDLQVLAVIKFLARGDFQCDLGTDFKTVMSQPSVSRVISRVLGLILQLQNEYLHFPRTREERRNVARQFRRRNRINSIIGLIDCFVVTCIRPRDHEEAYYNYRYGSSVNVQIVTDYNYVIQSVCVSAGSNNDQFIWNNCELRDYMYYLRNDAQISFQEGNYYLLGDSGYTASQVILTPIVDAPEGSPEATYTGEQVGTRCRAEQTIGILTGTWKAIKRARKLYYAPRKVADIITCCAILHNYRRRHGILDVLEQGDIEYDVYNDGNYDEDNYLQGVAERHNLIIPHYNR